MCVIATKLVTRNERISYIEAQVLQPPFWSIPCSAQAGEWQGCMSHAAGKMELQAALIYTRYTRIEGRGITDAVTSRSDLRNDCRSECRTLPEPSIGRVLISVPFGSVWSRGTRHIRGVSHGNGKLLQTQERRWYWYTSAKCADDCNCHIALFTAATVHSSAHPADMPICHMSRGHPDR